MVSRPVTMLFIRRRGQETRANLYKGLTTSRMSAKCTELAPGMKVAILSSLKGQFEASRVSERPVVSLRSRDQKNRLRTWQMRTGMLKPSEKCRREIAPEQMKISEKEFASPLKGVSSLDADGIPGWMAEQRWERALMSRESAPQLNPRTVCHPLEYADSPAYQDVRKSCLQRLQRPVFPDARA